MLHLLPVVARSHPLCWKLDPLCAICNVLSIGLQLGSCLTILIVAVRENACPPPAKPATLFSSAPSQQLERFSAFDNLH